MVQPVKKATSPRFTIENFSDFWVIGQGTYGKVYKARLTVQLDPSIALTNIDPTSSQTQKISQMKNSQQNSNDLNDPSQFRALKKIKLDKETDGVPITTMREMQVLQHYLRGHPNVVKLEQVLLCNQPQPFLPNQLPPQQNHQHQHMPNQNPQAVQPQPPGASTMSSPPTEVLPTKEVPSCFYLVFEYVPKDLQMLIKDKSKQFTSAEIVDLARQLLTGLAFIHERKVVHRDIKTANILVTNEGVVKYCDFGLARSIAEFDEFSQNIRKWDKSSKGKIGTQHQVSTLFGSDSKSKPTNQKPIMTGKLVTRWYRAPELLLEDQFYNYPVDVWSLGCCIAEILTKGIPLFPGDNELQTFQLICMRLQTDKMPSEDLLGYCNLKKFKDVSKFVQNPLGSPETKEIMQISRGTQSDLKGFICEKSPLWNNNQKSHQSNRVVQNNGEEDQPMHDVSGIELDETATEEAERFRREGLLDLCEQMLAFDWRKRPSCKELLKHPIFTKQDQNQTEKRCWSLMKQN